MTEKQEEKAVTVFADTFENEIKNMLTSGVSAVENPNVTFREFAAQWLDKMLRLTQKNEAYSLNHYEKCKSCVADANNFIGGYKLKELTPAIIQAYFDRLDAREKIVRRIMPTAKFKEILHSHGLTFNKLRHDMKIQGGTLAHAFTNKPVSKEWAVKLCEKTGINFFALFNETETAEPYAHETMDKIKRTISTILAQAKKNRLVNDNYASAQYIDFPPKPHTEIHCMDDEQAKVFFRAVMNCDNIRAKTSFALFILTGLRRGEVAGLQWKYVDLERRTITVYRTVTAVSNHGKVIKEPKTKNSKRTFTISKLLVDILAEYREWWNNRVENMGDIIHDDMDWLFFQNDGSVIFPSIFNVWLRKLLDTAGLKRFTVHSLRHTNITIQLAAGVPLATVSARAGHARGSITSDFYAHFIKSSDVTAADTLDDIFIEKTTQN